MRNIVSYTIGLGAAACILTLATGCQTGHQDSNPSAPATMQSPAPTPAATPSTATLIASQGAIRIKAGSSSPFTDSKGKVWQAEQGFSGGDVIDREPNTDIANTTDRGLFLSEHYGMDSFSCSVPNGRYLTKLYFAETFDGITGPGQRVFSFDVQGHQFKDFDLWVKAGGPNRAYVESVPVEVTDGKFTISFTSKVENPEINAIELIPQS